MNGTRAQSTERAPQVGRATPAVAVPELTPAQVERRAGIIKAAVDLAKQGGFDAVQMRVVAADANVALGTLYRYFPSKEYLLVSAMEERIRFFDGLVAEHPPRAPGAAARVLAVLDMANKGLFQHAELAHAMVRAVVTADSSLGTAVGSVEQAMTSIIRKAMDPTGAGPGDETRRQLAGIVYAVWLTGLVGLHNGHRSADVLEERLRAAVHILLPD